MRTDYYSVAAAVARLTEPAEVTAARNAEAARRKAAALAEQQQRDAARKVAMDAIWKAIEARTEPMESTPERPGTRTLDLPGGRRLDLKLSYVDGPVGRMYSRFGWLGVPVSLEAIDDYLAGSAPANIIKAEEEHDRWQARQAMYAAEAIERERRTASIRKANDALAPAIASALREAGCADVVVVQRSDEYAAPLLQRVVVGDVDISYVDRIYIVGVPADAVPALIAEQLCEHAASTRGWDMGRVRCRNGAVGIARPPKYLAHLTWPLPTFTGNLAEYLAALMLIPTRAEIEAMATAASNARKGGMTQ
jgi:hypothetical protein